MKTTVQNITAEFITFDEQPAIRFEWKNQIAVYKITEDGWSMLKGMISTQKEMWDTLKDLFATFLKEANASLSQPEEASMTEKDIRFAAIVKRDELYAKYSAMLRSSELVDQDEVKRVWAEYKKYDGMLDALAALKTHFNNSGVQQVRYSTERAQLHERYHEIHHELVDLMVAA